MKKVLFLLLAMYTISPMAHGDITWSSPTAISTPLTNASDAHVIVDSNGNTTAIWVESGVIKSSTLPFGGSWGTIATLSNPLNTSSSPKISIDGSNNVTAIWIESNQIESATMPSGGSWGAETSPISGSGASSPSLAVDSSGNAVAVWVRSGFIESSTRKSGTWSLVSVLSTANSTNPHVAISDFGIAIATWKTLSSGSDLIVADILTISTNTWATARNLFFAGTAAFNHNYPKVAVDPFGNALIAWRRYNLVDGNAHENVQVLISSMTQGNPNWSTAQIISNPGIRNPADLSINLKFDTSGDAAIFWTNSYDGETFVLESSQKPFGTATWPGFTQPGPQSIYSFGFDFDPAGGAGVFTSMNFDGFSSILIQSQQTDMTNALLQGFSFPQTISTGSDNAYPKCSLALNGTTYYAASVWLSFDGSNIVVNAATGTDSTIAAPTSVSASQSLTDFGVYQDYYNTITWVDSTDPDIIQYNIYRNGVFFGEALPGSQTFVDHNTIQNGTVTYGVAGMNSRFIQTPIVNFTLFP